MSIPFTVREAIDKAIPEIEKGRESYSKVAKHLGVGKATVYRRHIALLAAEVASLADRRDKTQTDLKGLEKTYGDLEAKYQEKHGILEGKYREKERGLEGSYQKLEANLKGQIEKLNQEQAEIKSALEAQGLGWNEGIRILKDVKNLRDEQNSLQGNIAKHTAELSNWEKEAKRSQSALLQLKDELSTLRETLKTEEGEFHDLLDQIISLQDKKRNLGEWVKGYEGIIIVHDQKERIQNLTAEIERLSAAETFLTGKVKNLQAERETLKAETEEQIRKAKELAERIVVDANHERERILKAAEREKEKILAEGTFELKELNSALKGEIEVLKRKLQQLNIDVEREERRKAETKEEPEKPVELMSERRKKIEGAKEAETEPVKVPLKEEIQKPPDKGAPDRNIETEALIRLTRLEETLDEIIKQRQEMRRKSL